MKSLMLQGFRRGLLIFIAGILLASSSFSLLIPSSASAAQANPQDQLERWLFYRGMRACLGNPHFGSGYLDGSDNETFSASKLNSDGIVIGNNAHRGFGYIAKNLDDGKDGKVECKNKDVFKKGAAIFGFPNVVSLVCAMNAAAEDLNDGGRITPSPGISPCVDNATEFKFDGGGNSIWQRMLTKALENPIAPEYGGDGDRPAFVLSDNRGNGYTYKSLFYLLGKNSLEAFCGGPLTSAQADDQYSKSTTGVSVYIVENNGEIKKSGVGPAKYSHTYVINKKDKESDKVNDVYYSKNGNSNEADDVSCADMAKWTRDGARDYATWVSNNQEEAAKNNPGGPGDSTGNDVSATSCDIDGIGWLICPVMNFLAKANEQAFGFIESMLGVRPEVVQDDATVEAWERFRDIANVAFVIAFMVIIYSQITSMGISNYGLKKLLPKIAVAAILVNLSLFICQILVDFSNIAGHSLYSFITNISPVPPGAENNGTWTSLMSGVLAGGAIVLLVVMLFLAPTVLLAVGMILLILVARQAFILILIIISPLAFVAYLLPNTEDLFKKWWKMLSAMLLVYPIIAVVFGASVLASNILMRIASQKGNIASAGNDDNQLLAMVALGVMAVPLFAVPGLLKGAMNGAGTIGAKLSNLQDAANRRGIKGIKESRAGEAKAAWDARRQANKVNARLGSGRMTRAGKFLNKYGGKTGAAVGSRLEKYDIAQVGAEFDKTRVGQFAGGDRGAARAVAAQQKITNEQIGNSIALLQNGDAATLVPRAVKQLEAANKRGDVVAARAATQVLTTQTGSRGIQEFHNTVRGLEQSQGGLNSDVSGNIRADVSAAGLKGKDRALDTWSRQEGGMENLVQHDAKQNITAGLNEAELAGQSSAQLANFAQTGSLTQQQAQRVLNAHERGTIQLDETKLGIFTERANSTEQLRVADTGVARIMAQREVVNRAHDEALVENERYDMNSNGPSAGSS